MALQVLRTILCFKWWHWYYSITKHLTSQKGHGIERNSLRDKRVKNQQATIVEAMQDAEVHPQKRRKMHESDGHSINPDMLEIL